MPDWLAGIVGVVVTALGLVAVELVKRWRAPADTNKVRAEANKIRAETRLLEVGEIETSVRALVDSALIGTAELIEQQRGEIVELRNRVSGQDHQISIMSETISSAMARIRQLETENQSLHATNLRLIERIDELEGQLNHE
jgi:hypothetical protein